MVVKQEIRKTIDISIEAAFSKLLKGSEKNNWSVVLKEDCRNK